MENEAALWKRLLYRLDNNKIRIGVYTKGSPTVRLAIMRPKSLQNPKSAENTADGLFQPVSAHW